MSRRKKDLGSVVGRITYIRFSQHGCRLTLSHPYWYFWAFIPGMRRRPCQKDGRSLVLPNRYVLEWVIDMLSNLPLNDPKGYPFDFNLTETFVSASAEFKRRGCTREGGHVPRYYYRTYPTDGNYATEVEVPKDIRKI